MTNLKKKNKFKIVFSFKILKYPFALCELHNGVFGVFADNFCKAIAIEADLS